MQAGTDRDDLWLFGGGGHAQVVAEAARLSGLAHLSYFDDRPEAAVAGCRYLGALQDAIERERAPQFLLAIGDLTVRRKWIARLQVTFGRVDHPTSIVSPAATISPGVFVGAGAVVNASATLGQHTIVNTRAVVEHDCQIGENSHVGPGAILGGGVTVGDDSLIGIQASVRPNVTIGAGCTVGAGAVVVRDVPDGSVVVGIPARPLSAESSWRRSA